MARLNSGAPRLLAALALAGALAACNSNTPTDGDGDRMLVARRIESQRELIGGPSARGKVGDYLLRNDRVRFIVAGRGQAWQGGVFGGTLLDADLVRKEWETQYGTGFDAFSETFPLVNLIETNPELDGREVAFSDEGLRLVAVPSGIEVIKDGSDGAEAIVRVSGRAGYIFEMLKFLNKDFLLSFLSEPLAISGFPPLPLDQLLQTLLGVNVYALINRLQVDFRFINDYILRPGDRYLTIRTTVVTAPPSEQAMSRCPAVECDLTCEHGFALREEAWDPKDPATACDPAKALCGLTMCPACQCASTPRELVSLNECEDIFQVMLGDLGPWKDPAWKGGILGGDFLFMGNETDIFGEGIGFDENRRIFENMWQGVPSLAAPLTFPWIAATAENVSYGWASVNPDRREGAACPSWRVALTAADYGHEEEVISVLVEKLGMSAAAARARTRQLIVDRRPLILAEGIPTGAGAASDLDAWKGSVLEDLTLPGVLPDPEDPEAFEETEWELAGLFPEGVDVELMEALECLPAKLVIPIFSTGATAVMTHRSPSSMEIVDGVAVDTNRVFTFERYFVVGEGDVGSVLETIYEIQGEATGHIRGTVVTAGSLAPISHASVFAVRDPRGLRDVPSDRAYETWDQLRADCRSAFADDGFVSQMQTDVGLDPVRDGDWSGPLPPGGYFLVAFSRSHGTSRPVFAEVEEGETTVAHLTLAPRGRLNYVVMDQGGRPIPCRLTVIPLDADGAPMDWDGLARVEMGGKRFDHGILVSEHSPSGQGLLDLPAGDYEIWVSRGFEYGIEHLPRVEVKGGETTSIQVALVKEVDTSGWISGDFHVHARPSIDAGLHLDTRIIANAAEGLEFITSTDHDYLTYYLPWINELDLQSFMKTAVGVETTTLEFGHYNGFPMEYRDTDLPVHDAPPWYGYPVPEVWAMMRARVQAGFTEDEFIVQVNHPRDGMMGYFAQFGLQAYNLQRKTPGMSMCNPQTERISCAFDAFEIMNEKRFELLRTPTIGEMAAHNACVEEILHAADPASYALDEDSPEDTVCGWLQEDPDEACATLEETLPSSSATGLERARLFSLRDHCRWHAEFREGMAGAALRPPLDAKRDALDALKLLQVRYQMERLPEEQEAFFSTTSATDLGCDHEKAMLGCTPAPDGAGDCEGCTCRDCVCAELPECCLDAGTEDAGVVGTGWTQACADLCASGCLGCGLQPCTSKTQPWDDWFAFLNAGFVATAMGNSDSHDTLKEVGLPRNYLPSKTDDPSLIDDRDVYRAIRDHRVIISTGPFAEFSIDGAGVGQTLTGPSGDTLRARIRIQTASWFGVDHVELHRNGVLEHILRVDPPREAIVDVDEVLELPVPDEDSWYVLVAYGLDSQYLLTPIYKRSPYGHLLIPTILSMGIESILLSFNGLMDAVGPLLGGFGMSVEGLLGGLVGSEELPDVFPMFPLVVTNPIWVDVDGGGFRPVHAVDADGDGAWDLPPFCSGPCTVAQELDAEGKPAWGRSSCGENQVCVPDAEGSEAGTCVIPIPENCVGEQV
ncbi:MAG: hypothetical protein FJ098_01995 [Deltaproteobacteria bacterium]|nr:hypothetical protein [Deltaproteobacteria bacterium]